MLKAGSLGKKCIYEIRKGKQGDCTILDTVWDCLNKNGLETGQLCFLLEIKLGF